MKGTLAALLVPPLLLLGFLLRQGSAPAPEVQRGEAPELELGPFLDPDAAWMARRVNLALSARRLPQSDRFLSHPHSIGVADPPVFPALLGGGAAVMLGRRAVGGEDGPPDERRLEAFLAQCGPALWVLLALAALFAARRGSSRGAGPRAGAVAVALLALTPVAVRLGAVGQLALEQWVALLFLVQVGLCRSAWSAQDDLDRLQGALLAGLVTGLGLASSPLFAAPALAAWAGFLLVAWSAVGPQARDRAREGLLFTIGAILPAQLPSMDGPWQPAPAGPVAEWVRLAGVGLLVACGLLVVGALRPAKGPGSSLRRSRAAWLVAGVGALGLVLLPLLAAGPSGMARPLRAALGLFPPSPGGLWAIGTGGAPAVELAPLALLFLAALWLGRRERPGPETIQLGLAGLLTGAAALAHAPSALLFLVPVALAADAGCAGAWGRCRGLGWGLLGVLALGAALLPSQVRAARAGEGRELAHALRWLRAESDPSGPWNAAGAGQSYGVLADGAVGGLVAYHARRPLLAAGPEACGDPRGLAEVRALLELEDPDALVRGAALLGARYIVVRAPASDGRWDGGAGPAMRALALRDAPVPDGAERVLPAQLALQPAAGGGGEPPVTIYRLERP